MLGAAADGLHRSPHVTVALHQVPARRQESVAGDASAVIDRLRDAAGAVFQHGGPYDIAIPLNHRVCAAEFLRLVGIKRGVDAAEYHPCSAFPRQATYLQPAECVGGMDADADDIARLDGLEMKLFQRLVNNLGVSV